jgi:hypothetical protein
MSRVSTIPFQSVNGKISWVVIEGEGADNYKKNGKVFKATAYAKKGSPQEKIMIDAIMDYWEDNKPSRKMEPKSLGFKPETIKNDEGDNVLTGRTAFTFTTRTTFKDGNKVKIAVLNREGVRVHLQGKRIGNGSKGVIHGNMGMYGDNSEAGVTLYLKAVQLVKLVEYDSIDAKVLEVDEDEEDQEGFMGVDTTLEAGSESATGDKPTEEASARPSL